MNDARLTIRLPTEELKFAKDYASQHGITLTGLIRHYIENLEEKEHSDIPPEVETIAGTVPADVDAQAEYYADMQEKHS